MLLSTRPLLCATLASLFVVVSLVRPVILHAQGPRPILVVPPSKTTINVATDLPEGLKLDPSRPWQLVEVDNPEAVVGRTTLATPRQTATAFKMTPYKYIKTVCLH